MSRLIERLERFQTLRYDPAYARIEGRITRMIGLTIEEVGLQVAIGECCLIEVSQTLQVEPCDT